MNFVVSSGNLFKKKTKENYLFYEKLCSRESITINFLLKEMERNTSKCNTVTESLLYDDDFFILHIIMWNERRVKKVYVFLIQLQNNGKYTFL